MSRFEDLGPHRAPPPRRQGRGLRHADPDPAAHHQTRRRRQGPSRRRADRHRQDPRPVSRCRSSSACRPSRSPAPRPRPASWSLSPTRELASADRRELRPLRPASSISRPYGDLRRRRAEPPDHRASATGVDIVVATPGRLIDPHRAGAYAKLEKSRHSSSSTKPDRNAGHGLHPRRGAA